jgi:hypothetical protein
MMNNLNANKMKSKELRKIIREAIKEVLLESESSIEKAAEDAEKKAIDARIKALQSKKNDISSGRAEVAEGEIEEMARTAKGYRLTDNNINTEPYTNKRISGVSLADIINYIRENPGAEKKDIQTQFNFVRPQIANAVINGLLDAGVVVRLGAGGEVEAIPEPGEEAPSQATEPEDMFMGSTENPLAMYFDGEPNADGSEDLVEPGEDELEKVEPISSKASNEDYKAATQYRELERRLNATKSNILKLKRSKATAGDIKDKPSEELQRLRALRTSLEQRINSLVASSDYVKKLAGVEIPEPPTAAPEEETEEPLDEWTLNKLQYYAGIIK